MRDVFIGGGGMTAFGKHSGDLQDLCEQAASAALADAGIKSGDVDLVASGNAIAGLITGQEMVRAQTQLALTGLMGKPMLNVENACASSASAFHTAWLAVGSGQYEVALVIGSEKMSHPDKRRTFDAIAAAADVRRIDEYSRELTGEAGRADSLFMDVYAAAANEYMERTGAAPEDFARVAVKNRRHGALNPHAQFREQITVEEVLASRSISAPLTLFMCSPIADGAAALVLWSEEYARTRPEPGVRVRACALTCGRPSRSAGPASGEQAAFEGGRPSGSAGLTPEEQAAVRAYEAAGLGPEDVDVVEVHDAAAPNELIVYEHLGLCGPGEAAALIRSGDTELGGRIPVNPSGGLLSKGHPLGATGCAQLVELTDQLRGRAGDRQVEGARVALAENAGGYVHPDPAACVVTILSAS